MCLEQLQVFEMVADLDSQDMDKDENDQINKRNEDKTKKNYSKYEKYHYDQALLYIKIIHQ